MSYLAVNNLQPRTGNTITVSGGTMYIPGHVVQVVSTYYTTPTSVSVSTSSNYSVYTDIYGIVATITPKSVNSKIYVSARWTGEMNPMNGMAWDSSWCVKRNGQLVGLPNQPGSLPLGFHMPALSYYSSDNDSTAEHIFFDYWDAPQSTSALTYQMSMCTSTGGTIYINRCVNGTTSGGYERGTSSITLMEIAG